MAEKNMTRDEIFMHNVEMIKWMRDEGMSPAVIHALFQKEGIDITLDFVQSMCKPDMIENLFGNALQKPQ
jgi:hypothetical protein